MLNELKFTLGPNLYFYLEQNSSQYKVFLCFSNQVYTCNVTSDLKNIV